MDVEMAEQVATLKQHADGLAADARPHASRAPRKTLSADAHDAAARLVESGETGEQGRLSASRWPDDCHDLAAHRGERDTAQRKSLIVSGVVEAVEIDRFEDRCHGVHRNEFVTRRQASTLSEPRGAARVMVADAAGPPEAVALDVLEQRLAGHAVRCARSAVADQDRWPGGARDTSHRAKLEVLGAALQRRRHRRAWPRRRSAAWTPSRSRCGSS